MEKQIENTHCLSCPSFRKSIFSDLNQENLQELQLNKRKNFMKKNSLLFSQGEKIHGGYCIQSGVLKTTSITGDGKENIRNIIKDGELAGLVDIFLGDEFQFSCQTISETKICFIEKSFLERMTLESQNLSKVILKKLSLQINALSLVELDLMYKNVKTRVIELLLKLEDEFGTKNSQGKIIGLDLSRNEMASMLGIAGETLIRVLTQLKQEQIISQEGKYLCIKDREALKNMISL
jgi:CRP/FNR family transcriptional regulator